MIRSLFARFFPGVLASIAVCLGIGWLHAQAPTANPPASAQPAVAQVYSEPAQHQGAAPQYVICGHCGAQLEMPRAVLVALPVGERRGAPMPGESFYGIPPVGYADYPAPCSDSEYRPGAPEQWAYPVQAVRPRPTQRRFHY